MNENHVYLVSLFFPSRLIFGTLYPAYYSYKAVKSKDIKEYVSSTDGWGPDGCGEAACEVTGGEGCPPWCGHW